MAFEPVMGDEAASEVGCLAASLRRFVQTIEILPGQRRVSSGLPPPSSYRSAAAGS